MATAANVGMSYAEAVVLGYSQQIQLDWMRQKGQRVMDPPITIAAAHLVQRRP